jgi:hypothetical protein
MIILCVLVLYTQVNKMFVMLLWVCIHTGQAEKLAWPRWESNRSIGNHIVSDMKILALCLISGSNNSRKTHEMHLISKLGTVHPHGINERFSYI